MAMGSEVRVPDLGKFHGIFRPKNIG